MLAASTVLVAAGVLPSTTAAAVSAPAATPHLGTVIAVPAVEWVKTTDPPSGITAELPGKARVEKDSVPVEGKRVEVRQYRVETPDAGFAFTIHDMPGDQHSLEELLQAFLDSYNEAQAGEEPLTSSDSQKTTVDGHPALDARLSTKEDDEPQVGFLRFIAGDDHLIQAMSFGSEANEKTVTEMHERFLDSMRIP